MSQLQFATEACSRHTQPVKELWLAIESIILGFVMAAPVGPVGVLCIRRSLRSGWWSGFVTGLGVAVCDCIFAFVSSEALSTVTAQLIKYDRPLKLVGGLILLAVGSKIFFSAPPAQDEEKVENQWHNFSSALMLAISNPLAILSFAAISVGVGILSQVDSAVKIAIFAGGVFLGSALWWYSLSQGTLRIRHHITTDRFRTINRVCGSVIGLFGVGSIIGFFR